MVSPCLPTSQQETLQYQQVVLVQSAGESLLLSSDTWCMQDFICVLQEWVSVYSVLWKSYNQIPLVFKVRFPGDSQTLCQIPRLGSLMWGSQLSKQWENFIGIIVLQFVSHLPGRYGV